MDTRLIIKHSKTLADEFEQKPGDRARNISALFVENQDGERFKYPFIHLAGARAMQRHVANGGLPYDAIGESIIRMSEEIAQLKSFTNYCVRNDLMNSDTNNIVERSKAQLDGLRERVAKLSKQAHYENYVAEFQAPEAVEVPDDVMEEYKEKFTVKNFKEDIANAFPIIYRLMKEEETVGYDDIVGMTNEVSSMGMNKYGLAAKKVDGKFYSYKDGKETGGPFDSMEELKKHQEDLLNNESVSEADDDKKEKIQAWFDKWSKYEAGNGNDMAKGYLHFVMDSGIATDFYNADEYMKVEKEMGMDSDDRDAEYEMDQDELLSKMPLTKQCMDELNKITGTDDMEKNAEMVNDVVDLFHDPNNPDPMERFENWVNNLGEESPITMADEEEKADMIKKLNELVGKEFPAGVDGTNAITSLEGIIEDPKLEQDIKKADPEQDVRPMVKAWVEENAPDVLDQLDFGDMVDEPAVGADEVEPQQEEGVTNEGGNAWDMAVTDAEGEVLDSGSEEEAIKRLEDLKYGKDAEPDELFANKVIDDMIEKVKEMGLDKVQHELDMREGNEFSKKVQDLKAQGAKKGTKFKTSDGEEHTLESVAEFIHSFYDRNTGTFPKGPEGVCTMVGKKFGEQAEMIARKMVERMAPAQEQGAEDLEELERIKSLIQH